MLKFVSTKPPKGKEGHSPINVPHKQARETFRLKDPSDEGRLQYFEAGEEDGRDTSTGTSEKISSQGEVLDSTVYDNYDNLQSTKSNKKRRVKLSEHSQKKDVSGMHVTGPRTHITESRTPSISSADSGLGYPQRTSQDSLDVKRFGYRHVTWSPDVSNGEASKYDFHVDVQIKDKKKSRGMIQSGKKSIQGISKFLMGDKHYKKNSKLEKSDKLHSKGKIASHAIINDYLATVQQEKKEDDKTSATVNISKPSPDKFQKSGSSQSSIPGADVNEEDTGDYYDNRETGQSQAKPTVFYQPKRVILSEHNGLQKFISLPTLAESQMERQDDKSSKFLFSPLYSSTPKRQYRRSEEFLPKNLKNKMVSSPAKPKEKVRTTADHEEHKIDQSVPIQVAPKTVTSIAPVMTATSSVSGTFNKGNAKKPLDSKYNAVQVGTTWSQHRPYSADYEEIPRTFDHLVVSESGHLSKSHGDLHLQSSSFEEPRLPPKWLRRTNYPRLHLPRMQPFLQHSSAEKKEKESRSELEMQRDRNEMAYAKLGSPTKMNSPQHVKDLQGLKELEEVMTSCVPQVNHEVNKYDSVKRFPVSREFPVSSNTSSNHTPGMSSYTHVINRSRDYQPMEDEQVDLVYITERIISMSFQSDGQESLYQSNVQEVFHMLRMKHGENVLVINISEPRDDLQKANNQRVIDYGWPDHIAPPLERLCNICKSIDSWLNSDPNHVILLHCKGGRARLGVIIAAFMHYSSICASSDQAMDRMAMNRFFEGKLGGLSYPSHQRYVQYFSGLLSSAIKINSNPLYLHHLVIHGVPNFDSRGGCRPFIKVYQGMQPIFTSGVYNVTDQMQKVCISISPGIPLRGDIMIKCYHKNAASGQREPIWRCQFHTCAISNYNLLFSKSELDDAINDPRFPDQGKVEFVFGPNQDANVPVLDFKSDVTVPVDDNTDGLVRWDSYENFKHVDGYTKTDGIIGNSTHSPQYMQNDSRTQKNYSSVNSDSRQYGSHNYSTSSSTKQTVPPLDEQTQLDNILSDLLNDQVFVTSPRSGSSTMSKETRTFRTYETQRGPDGKTINQSAEVTYKLPSEVKEERHYTIKTEKDSKSSYMPTNAFSYTPTSPELARKVDSPKTSTLPYRTDYDNRYHKETSYSYNTVDGRSVSDSDNSWLQQQQRKLREKKDVRDDQRVQQEKKLVEELRTAQNRYLTKRAKSEEEERNVMDSYNTVSNGPSSTSPPGYSYSMSRSHTYSSEKSPGSFSSGDSSFDSKITKRPPSPGLTRVMVQTNSAPISPPLRSSSKDFMQRSRAASTSSSWQSQFPQKFVRQNSDVTFDRRNDIQPPVIRQITITTPPRSRRPFSPTYQTSTYRYSDRSASSLSPPIQRKSYQQEHISPVMSSTTKSSYQQSYSTSGNDHLRSKSLPRHAPTKTKVTEIHEASLPEGQKKSHYITEVYVHRSPGNEDGKATGKFEESRTTSERSEKVDHEANRLEELEKSLKAASNSIIATQQPWQQSVSPTGGFTQEHVVTRRTETRKYETNYQQQQQATQIQRPPSPPHQTRTVEEDRFSLRPIGPGMQALEPEGSPSSVGTLNRSTTPSFPISPVASAVTPPFPVTPRTPYVNPGNQQTLQKQTQQTQQQQQFQYQTQQQQHFQTTQQYQTHHQTESMTHNGGPLHVDTSPRMLSSGTMSRSPGSTHSPETLSSLRQQLNVANSMSTGALSPGTHSMTGQSSPSVYFGLSRRGSLTSIADSVDATHATPRFVKDTSKFWYKPNITREEAIQLLKDKAPGTFVVRDSNSFPGAFGLALKVATIPPNVQTKSTGDPAADLVRHFLIEPTPKGVRLRGCNNEPVFGSLASLVYQHSLTPLALPCKLSLPEVDSSLDTSTMDSSVTSEIPSSAAALLAQGAACNVLYLNSVDTESLTGPQAVSKAIKQTLDTQPQIKQTVVHFKVSNQGITLTDNQRKLFFRRHYPVATVTYCGMDPDGRKIFGFVARKQGGVSDNACHLFAELDPEQPASAIVNFVTKVMIGQGKVKS